MYLFFGFKGKQENKDEVFGDSKAKCRSML